MLLDQRVVVLRSLVRIELDSVDEEAGQHRDDGQGADQRRQQGERDGQREGKEELADEPADEAERQEDGHGRERGAGDCAGDFTCTGDDRPRASGRRRPRWR